MEHNRLAAALALSALLLTAGCAQFGVHSTVNGDGEISEYRMNITTSRTAYGYVQMAAEEDGYENVSAYVLSDVNESQAEKISYDEKFDGDRVTMMLRMTDVDPAENAAISVTEEDGKLVYVDEVFYNESATPDESSSGMSGAMSAGLAVDYYLEMPGEITDSNADEVDGNTAEWHATGPDAYTNTRIYAESDKPTMLSAPGFGAIPAVLALLLGAFYFRRRS